MRILAVLLITLLIGCRADITQLNEQNPYFQKGMDFQQSGRYEKAAEAYLNCLRYSPDSYKAHLQLAILYEDHLQQLPRAIVHYQDFLRMAPDDDLADNVRAFLERARSTYYLELHGEYSDSSPHPPPSASIPPIIEAPSVRPPPDPPPAVTGSAAAGQTTTYQVKAGDTLSAISRRFYGDPERWREIYDANRDKLATPTSLQVGMTLKIPQK